VKSGFIEMEFQNNIKFNSSEQFHLYLKYLGYEDEFQVSEILIKFRNSLSGTIQTIDANELWEQWMMFLEKNQIVKDHILQIQERNWQFGSMIPKQVQLVTPNSLNRKKDQKLKPVFILSSILFWSIVYYFILFKIL